MLNIEWTCGEFEAELDWGRSAQLHFHHVGGKISTFFSHFSIIQPQHSTHIQRELACRLVRSTRSWREGRNGKITQFQHNFSAEDTSSLLFSENEKHLSLSPLWDLRRSFLFPLLLWLWRKFIINVIWRVNCLAGNVKMWTSERLVEQEQWDEIITIFNYVQHYRYRKLADTSALALAWYMSEQSEVMWCFNRNKSSRNNISEITEISSFIEAGAEFDAWRNQITQKNIRSDK